MNFVCNLRLRQNCMFPLLRWKISSKKEFWKIDFKFNYVFHQPFDFGNLKRKCFELVEKFYDAIFMFYIFHNHLAIKSCCRNKKSCNNRKTKHTAKHCYDEKLLWKKSEKVFEFIPRHNREVNFPSKTRNFYGVFDLMRRNRIYRHFAPIFPVDCWKNSTNVNWKFPESLRCQNILKNRFIGRKILSRYLHEEITETKCPFWLRLSIKIDRNLCVFKLETFFPAGDEHNFPDTNRSQPNTINHFKSNPFKRCEKAFSVEVHRPKIRKTNLNCTFKPSIAIHFYMSRADKTKMR